MIEEKTKNHEKQEKDVNIRVQDWRIDLLLTQKERMGGVHDDGEG